MNLKTIIGFGNVYRGEDAFGIDVIKRLQKQNLKDTKLLSLVQLTPELCLDLLACKEVIFIDSYFCEQNQYSLACHIENQSKVNLSHHISIFMIKQMLKSLYNHSPDILVYSMITNSFESINDEKSYNKCIDSVVENIKKN